MGPGKGWLGGGPPDTLSELLLRRGRVGDNSPASGPLWWSKDSFYSIIYLIQIRKPQLEPKNCAIYVTYKLPFDRRFALSLHWSSWTTSLIVSNTNSPSQSPVAASFRLVLPNLHDLTCCSIQHFSTWCLSVSLLRGYPDTLLWLIWVWFLAPFGKCGLWFGVMKCLLIYSHYCPASHTVLPTSSSLSNSQKYLLRTMA